MTQFTNNLKNQPRLDVFIKFIVCLLLFKILSIQKINHKFGIKFKNINFIICKRQVIK